MVQQPICRELQMKNIYMKSNGKMTSYERIMTAFRGGETDRVPVMILVGYWAAEQVGFSIKEIMENVEKHVFSQYYCAMNYGYDAVFDLSGIHAESEAMGCRLKYDQNIPSSIEKNIVKDYKTDLSKLKIFNPNKDGRIPLILEGIKRLKSLCKNNIAVIGYLQAPFRLATTLRGNMIYRDIIKNNDNLKKLLEITTYTQIIYGTALVHAGADIIDISDPTSSGDLISKKQWEELGFKCIKRVVKELKKTGVKIMLHICGDTSDRLDTFVKLGIDGMSLDQKVDLGYARKVMGKKICIIGNVNPTNLAYNTPDEISEESRSCIEKAGKNGSFILCSGCGVGIGTPPENIKAMVKIAQDYYY